MKKSVILSLFICISFLSKADTNKLTIGIGFFTDSISNISNQYTIKELLTINPLHDKDGKELTPLLTLRRGTTDYYINGKMNSSMASCNLFYQGKLQNQFRIDLNTNDFNEIQKRFYQELSTRLGNTLQNNKAIKTVKLLEQDFGSDGRFYHFPHQISFYSANIIPKIQTDSLEKIKEITKQFWDIEYLKHESYIWFYGSKEKVMKNQGNIKTALRKDFDGAWVSESNAANTLGYAQSVYSIYTSTKTDYWYFGTEYVSDSLKAAVKQIVLPYYKRQGASLTFLLCGWELSHRNEHEAALQCFSSALLMTDNLRTFPGLKEYLKQMIFHGMQKEYSFNKQGASAYICSNLAALHSEIQSSSSIQNGDLNFRINGTKIQEFISESWYDALDNRLAAQMAKWQGISSITMGALSTISDAQRGSSTLSAQTQDYFSQSGSMFDASSQMRSTAIEQSKQVEKIFYEAFGNILEETQKDNNVDANKPLLAYDFVQILANKTLAIEKKDAIEKFANSIPSIKPSIENYYSNINDDKLIGESIKAVYKSFSALEFKIFVQEAAGKETSEQMVTAN